MIKKLFVFAIAGLIMYSCGQPTEEAERVEDKEDKAELTQEEHAFLDNLASLCNKSFRGEQVYMEEGRESWEDMDFVMHVTVCEDDLVHIPFHLDDDESRTWMFLADEEGLRFRHDHRHEDGTPEEQTLYGGYADGEGTAYKQRFPVDRYSQDLLDDQEGMRRWDVVLDEDLSTFSYRLLYHGDIVFQADFDLTEPIDVEE